MTTKELMLNDWVMLRGGKIYCRVGTISTELIIGQTASGGAFKQSIEKIEAIPLSKDILLRTSFWMVTGQIFRKTAKDFAAFEYNLKLQQLEVIMEGASTPNYHYGVYTLHQLQQLYRLYTQGQELEVNILSNKRTEYNQAYYEKTKNSKSNDNEL